MAGPAEVHWLLWLLLPVAAASGWWAAVLNQKKKLNARSRLNSAYGQGLNHLLNEEPDKATEVLVRMVEVDPETVELHLALGSLFRRRGEVDRAIRIHQNIIARSKLSSQLRSQATLELGRDFLRAGLLDRAEELFRNLLGRGEHTIEASEHLVDLYQQQQEWQLAIEAAQYLLRVDPLVWKQRIALYYCELAEVSMQEVNSDRAVQQVQQAIESFPDCVRATLLKGRLLQQNGDFEAAIQTYKLVEQQEPGLLTETLDALRFCYRKLGEDAAGEKYIKELGQRYRVLIKTDDHKTRTQSGRLQEQPERYCCLACGFKSRKLFWKCPGCGQWSSVKPIQING